MTGEVVKDRNALFSAMSKGKPFKSYIKTILGKVFITYWDVFENKPVGGLLEGDPRKKEDGSYIDLYSEEEDHFFRRSNRKHFDVGVLTAYEHPENEVRERTIEEFSDDELKELINSPFLKLQNAINKTSSEAVVYRILNLAQDLEKSDKVITAIESRLSEIQQGNLPVASNVIEEEL